jgi:hypothetical protein
MSNLNPEPLSTSGRRALAATMRGTATRIRRSRARCWSTVSTRSAGRCWPARESPAKACALLASLWTSEDGATRWSG